MRDFLGSIDASLHIPTTVMPQALRINDCIQMDNLLLNDFTSGEVEIQPTVKQVSSFSRTHRMKSAGPTCFEVISVTIGYRSNKSTSTPTMTSAPRNSLENNGYIKYSTISGLNCTHAGNNATQISTV
jgi:hypothetical protein